MNYTFSKCFQTKYIFVSYFTGLSWFISMQFLSGILFIWKRNHQSQTIRELKNNTIKEFYRLFKFNDELNWSWSFLSSGICSHSYWFCAQLKQRLMMVSSDVWFGLTILWTVLLLAFPLVLQWLPVSKDCPHSY